MKNSLKRLTSWVDTLALRERGLLLAALLGVMYSLWTNGLMNPLTAKQKELTATLQEVQTQNAALAQQEQTMLAGRSIDPDAENKARLELLTQQIVDLDARLKEVTLGLIEPTQMPKVLQEVLTREPELTLVRIKNLGATPLGPAPPEGTAESAPAHAGGAYRHGLVIEFEGSYLSTLRYLKALEGLSWQLFWDSVEFKVQEFPRARVTISVHTLSLQEGWLGV